MFLPTCILEMLNTKGSRYNENAIKGLKVLRQAHKKKMYNKHIWKKIENISGIYMFSVFILNIVKKNPTQPKQTKKQTNNHQQRISLLYVLTLMC